MTTKLNTIQNGKGPKIRKGADLRKYWESEYWDNLEKAKAKAKESEQTVSECASPAVQIQSS